MESVCRHEIGYISRPKFAFRLYAHVSSVGKVNLCSPDHVALLVHRTFNVSIPRHHIPTDNWEYEHGPAENDPEFAAEEENAEEGAETAEDSVHGGRWVHKLTNIPLGGPDGQLEFTVIGYAQPFIILHSRY